MKEFATLVTDILTEILPDSDFWKTVIVLAVIFTLTRYPWTWLGRSIRYLFRWAKCMLLNAHTDELVSGSRNVWGQLISGTVRCRVCGRIDHFS